MDADKPAARVCCTPFGRAVKVVEDLSIMGKLWLKPVKAAVLGSVPVRYATATFPVILPSVVLMILSTPSLSNCFIAKLVAGAPSMGTRAETAPFLKSPPFRVVFMIALPANVAAAPDKPKYFPISVPAPGAYTDKAIATACFGFDSTFDILLATGAKISFPSHSTALKTFPITARPPRERCRLRFLLLQSHICHHHRS